jgi:tetratricopeptide (TPR) repeat protein
MGIAQYSSGRNDETEKSLLLAYREFDELCNLGQIGYTLDHLVELGAQRRNYDQALQYNGEARAIFEQIENPVEVADCYISRGRVLAQIRQAGKALEAYSSAKTIVMQKCNRDSKLMRMIDEETRALIGKLGWRKLLFW